MSTRNLIDDSPMVIVISNLLENHEVLMNAAI